MRCSVVKNLNCKMKRGNISPLLCSSIMTFPQILCGEIRLIYDSKHWSLALFIYPSIY